METHPGVALYELQQMDVSIARIQKRLKEIEKALSSFPALVAANTQLDQIISELNPLQKNQRDLDLQLQTNRQKRQGTEQRLYSGNVKNPKELQDMENEIAALNRRHAELEDRMLELMLAVEEKEFERQVAEVHRDSVQGEWATLSRDLNHEKEALDAELQKITNARQKASKKISPDHLAIYERLRPAKANQPVARLDDTHCSACGIELISSAVQEIRNTQNLLYCPNCKRIIVDTSN